ncbi:MAG: hypothetical protein AAF745_13740 [Planctomycetota bacterium]
MTNLLLTMVPSVCFCGIIDFETTPDGFTPVDNSRLDGAYVDGLTSVTFGIDSSGDFEIDTDVFFEQRGTNPLDSYGSNDSDGVFRGQFDRDDSGTGGTYFLRPGVSERNSDFSSLNGDAFLIVYSGLLPASASGSLWDVDANEINTVEAFDSGRNLLQRITLTAADGGDSLPATFSFDSLSTSIAFIRITNNAGPLGFDNFNATESSNRVIPEPGSLTIWLVVGLVCTSVRRKRVKPALRLE